VASEHPLASLAGARILEIGGNAIDAAITTSFVLAVTLPHLGGLGGDFFSLVRLSNGKLFFVNGSGYTPAALTIEYVRSRGFSLMPIRGPLTITVPGMVDGLHLLWKKLGSLEWSKLVEPAKNVAQRGFPATHSLSMAVQKYRTELQEDPGWRTTFLLNGSAPRVGQVVAFRGLAKALELIAQDPRSFYEGEIADAIASYVASRGGVLTVDDLRSFHAEEGDPLHINYRGFRIFEMPPNTQGITTLHMLMLLEEHDLRTVPPRSSKRIELFLDVARAAYWARDTYVTDPRFMKVRVDELLSRSFVEKLWSAAKYRGASGRLGDGDTTFFAVADAEGNIVAGVQSLFYGFGSGLVEPRFQIPLNSRGSSFSLNHDHVNRLEPRKKTMHTLSAVIAELGDKVMAVGLSGGHYRPLLHAQLLTNIIDYSMDPQEAIEHPRFVWELWSNELKVEEGFELDENFVRSYRVSRLGYPSRLGVAAIVEVGEKLRAGYCDVRGDGLPIGLLV